MSTRNTIFFHLSALLLLMGCSKEKDINSLDPNTVIELEFPTHIKKPDHTVQLTKNKMKLGQLLFFDKNLSSNQKVSCESCHKSRFSFADNSSLSPNGVTKQNLQRNSPPLFNLAWHKNFFWDGGAKNLPSQVLAPLTDAHEMNSKLENIEKYLKSDAEYVSLFRTVYNAPPSITLLTNAITAYELSITSFNTSYDLEKKGKYIFTSSEQKGYNLYTTHCSSCHTEGLFSDYGFHNNGIDSAITAFNSIEDVKRGRNRITLKPNDLQKYKTPSLRNLATTAPYMHDGRFETLEEVINHYANGVKKSTTLSDKIPSNGFNLNDDEKDNLISFLHTLNDTESFKK